MLHQVRPRPFRDEGGLTFLQLGRHGHQRITVEILHEFHELGYLVLRQVLKDLRRDSMGEALPFFNFMNNDFSLGTLGFQPGSCIESAPCSNLCFMRPVVVPPEV